MPEPTPKTTLNELMKLVYRRRALFLIGAMLFATLVFTFSHVVPLKYSGKTIFEFGLAAAAEEISRSSKESFEATKERLVHDLTGYQAMETAINELGLTAGLPRDDEGRLTLAGQADLQVMVNDFMKHAEVVWESRSHQEDLVSITFTHGDPRLAENMPNLLVRDYINRTYERIRTGLKAQNDFLQVRVEDAERQLEKARRDKLDFETRHAGLVPDSPAAFQEKIEQTAAALTAAKNRSEVARLRLARLEAVRKGPTTTAPAGGIALSVQPNPEYARLSAQLVALQEQVNDEMVLRHKTPAHPDVRGLNVKIEQTRQHLAKVPAEIPKESLMGNGLELINLAMDSAAAQSEADIAENETQRLQTLLDKYQQLWANFAPVRQEYTARAKAVDDAASAAKEWSTRLDNVQIALTAAVGNRLTRLNAIQSAQRQFFPSSPSLTAILALGIGGSLAFGASLVFLARILDRSIATTEEATTCLDVPVHGVIGEIVLPYDRLRRKMVRYVAYPALYLALTAAVALSGVSAVSRLRDPESYRRLWRSPSEFARTQWAPLVEWTREIKG